MICYDTDVKKAEAVRGSMVPFFEPGLGQLVERRVKSQRLRVTTSLEEAVGKSQVTFIAVGTPSKSGGREH